MKKLIKCKYCGMVYDISKSSGYVANFCCVATVMLAQRKNNKTKK